MDEVYRVAEEAYLFEENRGNEEEGIKKAIEIEGRKQKKSKNDDK